MALGADSRVSLKTDSKGGSAPTKAFAVGDMGHPASYYDFQSAFYYVDQSEPPASYCDFRYYDVIESRVTDVAWYQHYEDASPILLVDFSGLEGGKGGRITVENHLSPSGTIIGSPMPEEIYYTSNSGGLLHGKGGNDTIAGSIGHDTVQGGGGRDILYGDDGNDVLKGQSSNDILFGSAGADRLDGGTGIDRVSYEVASNNVTADLQNAARNAGIAKGDRYISIEHLQGSNHNDDLRGNGGNNTIWGRTGNDAIRGQGGNDRLIGNDGNDILIGGGGADTLNGGAGIDTLSYATASTAITIGLWDNSASRGDAAGDVIRNFENVTGGAGNDLLSGNSANNLLQGGAGSDTLHGGAGTDRLSGGGGRDILRGGANDDVRDVFIFQTAGQSARGVNRDVIYDFVSGLDDINLAQIDANNSAAGNQAFAWSGTTTRAYGIWTVEVGEHSLVRGDVNGDRNFDFEIAVRDVTRLVADDFIF